MSVIRGRLQRQDLELTCDVVIVGSGAGGSMLAAGLAARGLDVVVIEEGPYATREDFSQIEGEAYPMLYQDRFARATADAAIAVLQGRSVGGGTTVNWTTCFRTPQRVQDFWGERFGLDLGLDQHFDAVEQRLSISEWPEELANANNRTLLEGCRALGWEARALRRNVRGCANSGYCGLGCPYDAKQGMLVTTLQDLLDAGGSILSDCSALAIEHSGGRASRVHARIVDGGPRVTVTADKVVVAGGAINSPALLLASEVNPNGLVGQHTFLHPVIALPARYPHPIEGWSGAPQSIGSHQHIDRGDKVGFFMEVPPLQPMLASAGLMGFGAMQRDFMKGLRSVSTLLSLCADGFHEAAPGGTVSLRADGRPRLDYPISEGLTEPFRAAHIAMARVHMAAGATESVTLHPEPLAIRDESDLAALESAPYGALKHSIFTAHQMGGCRMTHDPTTRVVDTEHRVEGFENLYVVDGSVLPTSLGVNPSETIYALAHRAVDCIA
jgi:choline dehydrogenase-like flavoprotein